MKELIRNLTLIFIALLFSQTVLSQENKAEIILSKPSDGAFCELNRKFLEELVFEQTKNNEKLFVISRSGKSETINWRERRLLFTKMFLTQIMKFDKEKAVFAIGEENETVGKLEFYLGSKLFLVIEQPKNKISCLTCCEEYVPRKK